MKYWIAICVILLSALLMLPKPAAACQPTVTPSPTPTTDPTLLAITSPTPTLSPTPYLTPAPTEIVMADFVGAGDVVRLQLSYGSVDYAFLPERIYHGSVDSVVEFTFYYDPCDFTSQHTLEDTGHDVVLFKNNNNRSIDWRQVVRYTDDLHRELVSVTGHEPRPVMSMGLPLAVAFFVMNLCLWGLVVGRRLVQGQARD